MKPKIALSSFRTYAYDIIAILTVCIWGTTFVNTKVLIHAGLAPSEIFVLRFSLAYACIWFVSPRRLMADSLADEMLFALLGLTGGSIYFLTENAAVAETYVGNVSFIVCTAPLLTVLLGLLVIPSLHATPSLIAGSLIAIAGVAIVVFNGQFVLHLSPRGDLLALAAALCWAFYSLLIKRVPQHYPSAFTTRKVFFYGLLTVAPYFAYRPWSFRLHDLLKPEVVGNLAFLGMIASFLCFLSWSFAIKKIGAIRTSNYVYINPVTTLIASGIFLNEPLTPLSLAGCVLILLGVMFASHGVHE